MTELELDNKETMDYLDLPLNARERAFLSSVYYGREAYKITLDPCDEVPGVDKCIRAAYQSICEDSKD